MTPALVPFNAVSSTGAGEVRGEELGGMAGEAGIEVGELGAEAGVLARSWAIEMAVAMFGGTEWGGHRRRVRSGRQDEVRV